MKKQLKNSFLVLLAIVSTTMFNSCDDLEQFEPIGENSIADATPPNAHFTATQSTGPADAWKYYTFANSSNSATMYAWDFGNGETSTEVDGATMYAGEGSYTITLTASDNLGVVSTYSQTIEVVQPEEPEALLPEILEPGFDNGNDSRDPWRNSDLGGVIQITSSPVHEGSNAAKFPSAGDRIAYQELTVSPNSDYTLKYYYTLKTGNPGSITGSVLAGGGHTVLADALAATIESFEGTDQTDANFYTVATISFNTGSNNTVSILVTNQGEEARVDTFSITVD